MISPFSKPKPLIAAIHLPPSLSYESFRGVQRSLDEFAADLDACVAGGLDGILLENENDKPHTLMVSKAQVAWLTRVAVFASSRTKLPVGLNVQRIDWDATLAVAAAAELPFVRLDTFVDKVVMQGETIALDPRAILALRAQLKAERVALWTDIHVKHATPVDPMPLEASAAMALKEGAAALLISGGRTGEAPNTEDFVRIRKAIPSAPLVIASGLTKENARVLAPLADAAIVGTSLKDGERVSLSRVKELVSAWQNASA